LYGLFFYHTFKTVQLFFILVENIWKYDLNLRAFTIGLLLCASYLRTGSIIPAIVLHFLNDFIVFFDADMYSASGIGTDASMMSTGDIILGLVFDVVFAVLAFYVVRPAKRDEIMAIWAKKWSKK